MSVDFLLPHQHLPCPTVPSLPRVLYIPIVTQIFINSSWLRNDQLVIDRSSSHIINVNWNLFFILNILIQLTGQLIARNVKLLGSVNGQKTYLMRNFRIFLEVLLKFIIFFTLRRWYIDNDRRHFQVENLNWVKS